ncbi:MAG: hypothetical protein HY685_03505 [Chloroflexi bacterium]|nr:hypothetical protein [Chloroflexota bacterium]
MKINYPIVIAFASSLVINPIHLPFTVPWLGNQLAAMGVTSVADWVKANEGMIVAVGTGYFLAAIGYVYWWLFFIRRRKVQQAATVAVAAPQDSGEPYRGPGGGKRRPRARRHRTGRIR